MDSGVNEQEEIKIEDGFVWVERISIEEKEDIVNVSSDLAGANVTGNNEDEDILNVEVKEAADVDVLLMEQQYWQRDSTGKQSYSNKRKYRCRQRLTQSELDMIAHQKTIARSPSYYQFDESTTLILKMLRQKNIVGDYHNIVGYGKNSVVIHANWPASARSWYQMGIAVKVYKLQQDQYLDNVLLKRAQNEYNHLNLLNRRRSTMGTPGPMFKSRNVIATLFVGVDQETAPSIASVPIKDSGKMYSTLVNDLCKLYNEYNLVHGRLSSKNILFCYNAHKYIGWAHSVESDHPLAPRKLMRDCHFITEVSS